MKKNSVNDLAFFGGAPAISESLHVGRPNIGNRDVFTARVNDILDRRWLSNDGPFVKELEQKLAQYLDVSHCILICNGTVALEIASRVLGLHGEVILPSFTFIATAHALQWQGITPVFCDIGKDSHNIDPDKIEQLITPRTTGIIGVHVWGKSCQVEEIERIANRHNLKVFYDAAHAFGCSHHGQFIGNFGQMEVFSFHATKFFNTFEGGAIVTNNDGLARKIRGARNFGFTHYDQTDQVGVNGKMSEISAAMGLTGLESLDEIISINQQHYKTYQRLLSGLPGVHMVQYEEAEKNNYQYIVLEIDETVTQISRDIINDILHAENVLSRRYFYPGCHQMEPYRSNFPNAGLGLPETEKITLRVLQLPTGTSIGEKEIVLICELIRFAVTHGLEIQKKLKTLEDVS